MRNFLKSNLNKLLTIAIYIVMFYVVGDLLQNIFADKVVDNNSTILYTVLINVIIDTILIISCVILLKTEIVTDFKIIKQNNAVKIFLSCLAGVGLVYAGNFIGSILTNLFGGQGDSANQAALEKILFSEYGFIMIIFIVLIGPITEELIFRKSMHNILRYFKLPSWAILLISSTLFGLIHVVSAGDFVQVFPYVFMGLSLGWLEIKNKNIFPSIFVHIFINSVSTVMIFYLDKFQDILPV